MVLKFSSPNTYVELISTVSHLVYERAVEYQSPYAVRVYELAYLVLPVLSYYRHALSLISLDYRAFPNVFHITKRLRALRSRTLR